MPALAHVPDSYAHYAKQAVSRGTIETAAATLKHYHIHRPGEPVPEEVDALARAALADTAFAFCGDLGFTLVHRCGANFYFLLPTLWRGANEAWEAVWYLHADMPAFRPFDPAYPPASGPPRPTFCVWELGVVAHEAAAWSRFLTSSRGDADLMRWQGDCFGGQV